MLIGFPKYERDKCGYNVMIVVYNYICFSPKTIPLLEYIGRWEC